MRYRPKHTKPNKLHFDLWIMRIAATIGCLTIISAYLLSGVYAKFSTSASGSDSARVAKFDVSVSVSQGQESSFTLTTDNKSVEYSFAVVSNSEVAVEYDVVITFPETIPSSINLKLDGKSPLTDGTTCTFEGAGTFSANGDQNPHKLTVSTEDFGKAINITGITVKIVASQID